MSIHERVSCLQIVGVAQSATPFVYDPKTAKKRSPNRRRRWLIPLLIIAQVAFKVINVLISSCRGLQMYLLTHAMPSANMLLSICTFCHELYCYVHAVL